MEEDPLKDLEARMKRGFRIGFDFIRRLRNENRILGKRIDTLTKRIEILNNQVKNLTRMGDN